MVMNNDEAGDVEQFCAIPARASPFIPFNETRATIMSSHERRWLLLANLRCECGAQPDVSVFPFAGELDRRHQEEVPEPKKAR